MTPVQYQQITEELLVEPWGQTYYPIGQLNRLWQIVQDVSDVEFRTLLEGVLMVSPKAPSLGQIQTACMPALARAKQATRQRKLAEARDAGRICQYCGGSGTINAALRSEPTYEFAFRCNECQSADIMGISRNTFPTWGPHLEDKYALLRLTKDGYLQDKAEQRKFQETEVLANIAKRLVTHPWALKRASTIPGFVRDAFPEACNWHPPSETGVDSDNENRKDDISKYETNTSGTLDPSNASEFDFPWEQEIPVEEI